MTISTTTRKELRTSATWLSIILFFAYFAEDTRMHVGNMTDAYNHFASLAQ